MNTARTFNINANLEPVTGLKIDLTGSRVDSRNTQINICWTICRNSLAVTLPLQRLLSVVH